MRARSSLTGAAVVALLTTACEAPPEIHFNEPPEPGEVGFANPAPDTREDLEAVLVVAPSDPEGDALSNAWCFYKNGAQYAVPGTTVAAEYTARGDVWRVEVVASDGEWETEPFAAEIIVLNAPPDTDSAELSPREPDTDDTLLFEAYGSDADGDEVEFLTRWFADGVEAFDLTNALEVPADKTSKGETWQVEYTPTDGMDQGSSATASVTIGNTLPTIGGVHLSPDEPTVASSLTASVSNLEDIDGDDVTTTLVWYVDSAEVETVVLDAGSTMAGLSYAIAKGQQVWVTATPSDEHGVGDPLTSSTVTVVNSIPTLEGVSLSPTTATEETELECSWEGGDDADGDEIDYTVEWYVSKVALGLDQTSLDGECFDRGDTVQCTVTPSDGQAPGAAVASETVEIDNTPPTFTGVVLEPGDPTVADTMTANCEGWSDADEDSPIYSYEWLVSGSTVSTSGDSLDLASYARGDTVAVSVSSSDGYDAGPTIVSDTFTVVNAVPSISSVGLSPSPAYTGSDLSAHVSGFTDADGDDPDYTYAWYVGGSVTPEIGSTLGSSNFIKDDTVYVEVTPGDGLVEGGTVASGVVRIQNTAPVAAGQVLDTLPVASCTWVQLDASESHDADADALEYSWSITSQPATSRADEGFFDDPTAETPTFLIDASGNWILKVTVSDGTDSDDASVLVSSGWRATNTEPVADAGDYADLELTTGCTSAGYNIICSGAAATVALDAGGSADDDGDPSSYLWTAAVDPPGPTASFDDDAAEQPVLTIEDMQTGFSLTETYTVTVTLDVFDCANGSDEASTSFDIRLSGS